MWIKGETYLYVNAVIYKNKIPSKDEKFSWFNFLSGKVQFSYRLLIISIFYIVESIFIYFYLDFKQQAYDSHSPPFWLICQLFTKYYTVLRQLRVIWYHRKILFGDLKTF